MSNRLKPSHLPITINKLFQRLSSEYSNKVNADKKLSSEDLLELSRLFGANLLESALDLIDRDKIKIYRSQSKIVREFIEIPERDGIVYKLLPNINYCSCEIFCEEVLEFKSQYTCKHVLAAKLTVLLGKEKVETIAGNTLNFLFQ